jgi:predicted nucleic-acid-binding protein
LLALDSNVLVRYLVEDDPVQTKIAAQLIETKLSASEPAFVSLVVVCEIAWVLKSGYGFKPAQVRETLMRLSNARQLSFENADIVDRALSEGRHDPADMIIHELGQAHGCSETVTFDRRFAKADGVRLLSE